MPQIKDKINPVMPHAIAITFGIIDLDIASFNFSQYALENKKEIPFEGYEFQFKFNMGIDQQNKQCSVTFNVELFEKKSEMEKIQLVDLQSFILFTIVNFEEIIIKKLDNVNYNIPDQLIILLAGISLSTSRGILAAKLDGSIYKNAIIPIMDPKSFIPPKPNI